MWVIEIGYKYTNIVSRLIFDTEDQAKAERAKLLPVIGKDRFDLKQNDAPKAVTLIDKAGTVDVVPTEIKAVRCYDLDLLENEMIPLEAKYKVMAERAKDKALTTP